MAKFQELMTIVSQREVASDIFEMVLTGEIVEDLAEPGRFLNIKVPGNVMLLRRPISISEWNKEEKTCTILYRAGDDTTGTGLLSELTAGDKLDVMGPLGTGFDISDVKSDEHILIIGGGIGVPPLYELAKQLNEIGCQITVLLGFANQSVKILEEKFENLEHVTLQITTDDGSYGAHGHIGFLMDALDFEPNAVYTCGAPGMLKAVAAKYEGHDRLYISTEARMACGIGACYACVVHTKDDPDGSKGHALKICEDGPVLKGGNLIL